MYLFVGYTLLFIPLSLKAQKPVADSLRKIAHSLPANDTSIFELRRSLVKAYIPFNADSGKMIAKESYRLAESMGYKRGMVMARNDLAGCYWYLQMYDSAIALSEETAKTAGALYLYKEKGIALRRIGICYTVKGAHDKSLPYYEQAIDAFTHIADTSSLITLYGDLSRTYNQKADHGKETQYAFKVMELAEASKDSLGMADAYQGVGNIYLLEDDYKNSIAYVEKAVELYKAYKSPADKLGAAYIFLGINYTYNQQFQEAEDVYDIAMEIFVANNMERLKAILLENYGWMYMRSGQYSKSNDSYEKSFPILSKLKLNNRLCNAYVDYGESLRRQGKYEPAKEYLAKAIDLGKQTGRGDIVLDALQSRYKLDSAQNNMASAFVHYQKLNALEDSLYTKEKEGQIKELQVKYETEQKKRQIVEQKDEIRFLEATGLFKTRLAWAIGISAMFLFGSAYWYRSYRFALNAKKMEEEFSRQLLISHEEERKRISRDLHDSVGQSLILIKNKVVLHNDNNTVNMVSQALEEVRTISKALHPAVLDNLGLTASIKKLVQDADQHTDIFLSEEIENIDTIFPKEHELQVYRIVQEALNNVIKHSQTESAEIKINNEENRVIIQVIDYGVGFDLVEDTETLNSLGMRTLKERTKLVGGKIEIDSIKGKGTKITLVVDKPNVYA
ncbi:tetratricopeptide repeat protein [Fulvivirga sp. 29W222]|uniref:histidine kinase n=1 Tax=Fulvivirga marina TaxID=2494733 RepID=A0A937G0G3_9BACT|nr:ATP-binding protein [Fulvivirga marina]MBL6448258.1 tetratricopeptide repeat protein [Fulvivirga marina]